MSFECPICQKSIATERGLIQHTESVHGRTGVYKGARAWEKYRGQDRALTTGVKAVDTTYTVDDDDYDYEEECWRCNFCQRGFNESRHLLQHLESGVHENKRYDCKECGRLFTTMSAQRMHFESTGHSRKQERLSHTLISDTQNRMLMITNGSSFASFEATLNFDGSVSGNPGHGGAGWVLVDDRGRTLIEAGTYLGNYITNNEAEYQGLINGLEAAIDEGIKRLLIKGDSEVVIKQMKGEYQVHHPRMQQLFGIAQKLIQRFHVTQFTHVDRQYNGTADLLARQGRDREFE